MRLQQSSDAEESQSDWPATEKARGPSVLSRHRGTTNKRRVAYRRYCRAETSDTGIGYAEVCQVPRYLAVQTTVHYDAELALNSLTFTSIYATVIAVFQFTVRRLQTLNNEGVR